LPASLAFIDGVDTILFSPKNLQLLKKFVLLHQLEKSELKNGKGPRT
jgi:hypothetical protein